MKKIFTTFIMVAIGVITSFAQMYTVNITPNNPELGEVEISQVAFSVSATKKVRFSPGNLQYQASTNTWRFAENQWDYVGSGNQNISSTYSGWIDLFGWGTSGWNGGVKAYQPYSVSNYYEDYCLGTWCDGNLTGVYAKADWGVYNAISNGGNQAGLWRTLTNAEWSYLLHQRSYSLRSLATVNGKSGLIILPDNWVKPAGISYTATTSDYTTNIYTVAQWITMEAAGAVFLPAAGYRNGRGVSYVGKFGSYWTATLYYDDGYETYCVNFDSGGFKGPLDGSGYSREYGRSVRLCTDIK